MTLSPRDAKTLGTIAGIAVFLVPLAAMGLYTWYGSDLEPRRGGRPARRTNASPGQGPLERPGTRPAPRRRAPVRGEVELQLRRVSRTRVEAIFRSTSDRKLKLVAPGRLGGLIAIVARGASVPRPSVPRPAGPAYDPDTDALVELLPGASYTCAFDDGRELPPGAIRAVYDSRGEGLPEGAWRGRVESNVVR